MNLKEKWFHHFIGVDTKRDEYQLQEIRRILANMAIFLWVSMMILQFILMILDQINHQTSAGTIGLFIINVGLPIYFYIRIGRAGLNITEFSDLEELQQFKKRVLYRSLILGAFLGLVVYFITSIVLPLVMREAIHLHVMELLIIVLFGTIFIGGILYLFARLRLKKYEED